MILRQMYRVFVFFREQEFLPRLLSISLRLPIVFYFKIEFVRLLVVNTFLNLFLQLFVRENLIQSLKVFCGLISRRTNFEQGFITLRLHLSFGHIVVSGQEVGEFFGVRIQTRFLNSVNFGLNSRHFQESLQWVLLFQSFLLQKAGIVNNFSLHSSCHVLSKERVEVFLLSVALETSPWRLDIVTMVVQARQIDIFGQNLGNFVVHLREIVRVIVNESLFCLGKLLFATSAYLAPIRGPCLQKVVGFVRCKGSLVDLLSKTFSLFAII